MAEECNERNRQEGFTMYKVDGEYCFEGLRVGPKVKIPSKDKLLVLLGGQPINAAAIRNITYTLLREELARMYGTTAQEIVNSSATNLSVHHTRIYQATSSWFPTGHINGSATTDMYQRC